MKNRNDDGIRIVVMLMKVVKVTVSILHQPYNGIMIMIVMKKFGALQL